MESNAGKMKSINKGDGSHVEGAQREDGRLLENEAHFSGGELLKGQEGLPSVDSCRF